ncbi:hypothetical protein Rhopal_001393-T1 [Rhodotorula paludigena]|uniref:DUF2421 domain-containing protein n=1 Tax=Rhodotorula paludigena TaxID=86838 RepID=A0AAV5GGD4_9BASI|nr:hypothetical protein Rhopal_001393-T1 [Rhodotorula paludigena]
MQRAGACSRRPSHGKVAQEPESYTTADSALDIGGGASLGGESHGSAAQEPSNSQLSVHDAGNDDVDDKSDTSDDEDAPLLRQPKQSNPFLRAKRRLFPLSALVKNVLKCVVAYYLAEQFTFHPNLSDLVGAPWDVDGPVRNAHVVATVAVYFMPARTQGGMIEANLFVVVGAAYAVFLTCGSMAFAVLFERLDALRLGHAFVLLLWLGGGYALLAYVKVVFNKPTLSTACSLVSLVCSPIITKEGAYHLGAFRTQSIQQVLFIALVGALISNVICFAVWPQSATSRLQSDVNKTLESFGTLVEMLTKTFLLDTDFSTRPAELKKAIDAHQAAFTTLKSSLSQAKYEVFDSRMAGTTKSYDAAVSSMTRLAQGLTGMRAGCALQWELLQARDEGRLDDNGDGSDDQSRADLLDELAVLERFRDRVAPSLQQLTVISKQSLQFLQTSFVRTRAGSSTRKALRRDDPEAALSVDDFLSLQAELEQSLTLFRREHSKAVKVLYRSLPERTLVGNEPLVSDPFADPSTDSKGQAPNDNLFRIYHFCFNYEEWAAELLNLLNIFLHLRATEEHVEREILERRRRWGVFAGCARFFAVLFGRKSAVAAETTLNQKAAQLGRQFSRALQPPRSKYRSVFPKIVDGALSSHQVESSDFSFVGRIKLAFWRLSYRLREPNVRFAIKTGAGAAVLASAAFIPRLRPRWLEWRGEWALISYMVIMAPALGATNFLAFGRVVGTAAGAVTAVGCYEAFPENPVVLPILGALFSAPCFYVAITRASRFVLLTFNLTCLYCFNLREADTRVVSIAFHRSIAVIVGVMWGLLINSYVWPFEARRELRRGLSEFFLNSSYLYERIVRTYSHGGASPLSTPADTDNEHTALLSPARSHEDFVAMEIELQLTLIRVNGLLASTKHEPRLKGPFPVAAYRNIVISCQAILDSLTAVVRMTKRDAWLAVIRRDFVLPVNRERRELVGNVVLYFSLLSSAVMLKSPMPAFLPPAAEARERLILKLRELEIVKRRLVRGGSESLLYYAYALSMKDVISQLNEVGATFQHLFGVIGTFSQLSRLAAWLIPRTTGGSTVADFEALFEASPSTPGNLSEDDSDESSSER